MPRTKLGAENRKYDKLVALLRGNALVAEKTYEDMTTMLGWKDVKTVASRFNNPEKFTLDEITRLGRGLNIPVDELRQCIRY